MDNVHTTSGFRSTDGRVRRRAKIACRNCNSRKVRCNVAAGLPCTNCLADGVECQVAPRKKRGYVGFKTVWKTDANLRPSSTTHVGFGTTTSRPERLSEPQTSPVGFQQSDLRRQHEDEARGQAANQSSIFASTDRGPAPVNRAALSYTGTVQGHPYRNDAADLA